MSSRLMCGYLNMTNCIIVVVINIISSIIIIVVIVVVFVVIIIIIIFIMMMIYIIKNGYTCISNMLYAKTSKWTTRNE